MSSPDQTPDGLSSADKFQRSFSDLLLTARANNIDITGGWQCEVADGDHDYGIEIYRVIGERLD